MACARKPNSAAPPTRLLQPDDVRVRAEAVVVQHLTLHSSTHLRSGQQGSAGRRWDTAHASCVPIAWPPRMPAERAPPDAE